MPEFASLTIDILSIVTNNISWWKYKELCVIIEVWVGVIGSHSAKIEVDVINGGRDMLIRDGENINILLAICITKEWLALGIGAIIAGTAQVKKGIIESNVTIL